MSGRRRVGRLSGLAFGFVAALTIPAMALAHPLGNFTINHYAGIRVEPDRIQLDIVLDQAEIPTFQARLAFDLDGDGEVSDDEADAGRLTACNGMTASLELVVDGVRQAPVLTAAGLTFPPGVGGLSTMRFVCEYDVALVAPISAATTLTFRDSSFADRLGWREIVVEGSGVTVAAVSGELRPATISNRLSMYPTNQLAQAPLDTTISLTASPGGTTLSPYVATDASPVPGAGGEPTPAPDASATASPRASAAPVTASVPGGAPGGVSGSESR